MYRCQISFWALDFFFQCWGLTKKLVSKLILSFKDHWDNAKATNTRGKESQKDVSSGNQPESKYIDSFVAKMWIIRVVKWWGINPVYPNAAWKKNIQLSADLSFWSTYTFFNCLSWVATKKNQGLIKLAIGFLWKLSKLLIQNLWFWEKGWYRFYIASFRKSLWLLRYGIRL